MSKEAIKFLQWFRPEGPWVITAIVPEGKITTSTFWPGKEKLLDAWLEPRLGFENLYFTVNLTEGNLTKKPKKEKIVAAQWLHVDVDPKGQNVEAERKRILDRLKGMAPAPSLIIDSGNGYQGFWRLSEQQNNPDPSEDTWHEFERYNRQLEVDLGGDHCWNVDRIMRLPGTINVPNKKKLKAGRVKCPTSVVCQHDVTFEIGAFPQAPLVDGGDKGDIGRPRVEISGDLKPLEDVDDLDEYGEISQHVKMLIVQGEDPDRPDKYSSRSEITWFVFCELVRQGVPDDVIAAIFMDDGWLISGHCLDQKNPQGYVSRQIQRAHEFAMNPSLVDLNDDHFVTMVGGKTKVVRESMRDERRDLTFMDAGSFQQFLCNKKVEIGVNQKGEPITMEKGKWWMKHEHRRTYQGMLFAPDGDIPQDHYNLWRGFSCQAVQGNLHERWLDHVFENICNGEQEHFDYLIRWVARVVQSPATQSETAIVMQGQEGTGKNSFVGTIGSLFPEAFFESSSSHQFLGNFNSHLRDKVLVHANEAFFAGDKKHEATLKMLITEGRMPIEAKGVDITMEPNYIHLLMSSNSEWVVPAGPESRRFFVIEVSSKQRNNETYFGPMKDDLANGGKSHLLRYLLDFDLSDFSVRKLPTTAALTRQRLHSMPAEAKWWLSCLEQGTICTPREGWKPDVACDEMWQAYVKQMDDERVNYRLARTQWGIFLKKVAPGLDRKSVQKGGVKMKMYYMPDLSVCRDHFDKKFGGPFDWPDDEELDINKEIPF